MKFRVHCTISLNFYFQIVPLTLHPEISNLLLNYNKIPEVGPASFQFHPELRTVNLEHSNLVNLQDKTFEAQRKLVQLDLSKNQVTVIRKFTFFGLISLDSLDLSFNSIQVIDGEVFIHMPNLTQLNLGNNQIRELNSSAFSGLGSLEVLRLDNNRIESVAEEVWESLSNLRYLHLAHNQILELNPRPLNTLHILDVSFNPRFNYTNLILPSSIRSLNLTQTGLQLIPTPLFQFLPSLEILVLNKNNLTSISRNAFKGLKRLKILEIMENKMLERIDGSAFQDTRSLTSINISHNQDLYHLDPEIVSHLENLVDLNLERNRFYNLNLDLGEQVSLVGDGNPWMCDCNIQSLQILATGRNMTLTCSEPENLAGRSILDLDLSYCKTHLEMSATGLKSRKITMIIVLVVVLSICLTITGFILYSCRTRIQNLLKGLSWRKPEIKETQYSPEYQRSFIQHDEYFISLARQTDPTRHIPVTEL